MLQDIQSITLCKILKKNQKMIHISTETSGERVHKS